MLSNYLQSSEIEYNLLSTLITALLDKDYLFNIDSKSY